MIIVTEDIKMQIDHVWNRRLFEWRYGQGLRFYRVRPDLLAAPLMLFDKRYNSVSSTKCIILAMTIT